MNKQALHFCKRPFHTRIMDITSFFSSKMKSLSIKFVIIYQICTFAMLVMGHPLEWKQYSTKTAQRGPAGRKFHSFGFDVYRQFLVVFGGLGQNETILSDTWVLDVAAGRWYEARNGHSQPEARYGSIFGMYNGHLIIASGCDHKRCFDDIWSFNIASYQWTRIQAVSAIRPKPRKHASGGIFMHGKNLVISGGITANDEYLSDTYSFDLSQTRWHQVEAWQSTYDPSSPHPRAYQASAMIQADTMLTFGGCIKKRLKTNEVSVYHIKNKKWSIRLTEGAKLPGDRVGAAFASTGQALYLFGGEIEGRFPNDIYILTGDPNSTSAAECGESFFTLISLHGLLVFFGFAVLLQFGGALAQYSSIIREPVMMNWRYLHKVVQGLGLAFVFCGFVCGIAVIPDGHYHFQSVHGGLGLFVFILLLIQAFLGFLSLHYHELRTIILIIHFWNGVALLLLAYVDMSLGLFLALSPMALWISWFVYLLILCCVGCFVLAYDCCKEKRLLNRIVSVEPEREKYASDAMQMQQGLGHIPHASISYRTANEYCANECSMVL